MRETIVGAFPFLTSRADSCCCWACIFGGGPHRPAIHPSYSNIFSRIRVCAQSSLFPAPVCICLYYTPSPSCDNPSIFFFRWPFFHGGILPGECRTDCWCPAICYLMAKFDTDNLALLGVVTRHMWVRVCAVCWAQAAQDEVQPPISFHFLSFSLSSTESEAARSRTL